MVPRGRTAGVPPPVTAGPRSRRDRVARAAPDLWATALALLLLGPALGWGYVLSYDMVWVPDLALRPGVVGLGSGLPRAVPSDAVVAVLDELVGGMVLQKLVLLGALVMAGSGASRLVHGPSTTARLVAAGLYVWNPFVAERLLIGHWPLLLGYAVLPWVVVAARRWRDTGRVPAALLLLLPLGSLSASAGLATAVVLLAFAACRRRRRLMTLTALLIAANAPWLVAGALRAGDALVDPTGARLFALRGEGSLPAPLAALGLGGIWNTEVVPGSRTGPLAWAALVLLVVLVALGLRSWWASSPRRESSAFVGCWVVGYLGAVATWAVPGITAWLGTHVPGGGLVRDGARLLAVCAPFVVVVAAHGAARALGALPRPGRPSAVLALLLLPLATMPDAALGLGGRLSATTYPSDYAVARAAVEQARAAGGAGDAVLLPFSSYRQPAWNGGRKVLDPVGRYLTPDAVAADDLFVSGVRVAGEDARARQVRRALQAPDPVERGEALAALGVGFVVTERDAGRSPAVSGRVLTEGRMLRVQQLEDPRPTPVPLAWSLGMGAAWAGFAGLLVLGGLLAARSRRSGGRHTVSGLREPVTRW